MSGILWMTGTPLGNLGDLSERARAELNRADFVACEDTRRTAILVQHCGGHATMLRLDDHASERVVHEVVERVTRGERGVYASDAGMPGVSDPGARIVRAMVQAGLALGVLPGPSAVTTALALSGFDAREYWFGGFLPRKAAERERWAGMAGQEIGPVVVFLSPHRVQDEMRWLSETFRTRAACVCRELTKLHETIERGTLEQLATRDWPERGEYTVVLEPAAAAAPASQDDSLMHSWIARLSERGLSGRALVDTVCEITGSPKSKVYDAVLQAGNQSSTNLG